MITNLQLRLIMTAFTFLFVGWIAPPIIFGVKANQTTVQVAAMSAVLFFLGATLLTP